MILSRILQLSLVLSVSQCASAIDVNSLRVQGPQRINLWRLRQRASSPPEHPLYVQDSEDAYPLAEPTPAPQFPVYTFTQPLDHFYNSTTETFEQRYWFNARHYKPGTGAPVIVIDGGETSGEDRLPFLDTGIADILANATGGVGVVLEHRYYGESTGVKNLTTDSLRWLNNEQSMEDSATFMRNVKFEGIDEDLTAPNTPWIYYGGSYAGARAAHMRIVYPDIVYGAIASSAVTHAALTNWEYMDTIRLAADPICSANLVHSVAAVDTLLKVPVLRNRLKALFGLGGLESDQDFVQLLTSPLGAWQGKNWDPAVGSTEFEQFCDILSGNTSKLADTERTVEMPGGFSVNIALLNYAKYIKENVVSLCPDENTVEECFGTNDDAIYQVTDLSQEWRLWLFQVCTQWAYFTTAPPDSKKYPPIISRLLDLDYEHKVCKQAFPPGKHMVVPRLPNVAAVNVLGDFDITADRLAFIDGEVDPWRPDTPHSQYYAKQRTDTILRPFKLIPGGVHHWDENGLEDNTQEPQDIRKIHREEVEFVRAWLKDFNATRHG